MTNVDLSKLTRAGISVAAHKINTRGERIVLIYHANFTWWVPAKLGSRVHSLTRHRQLKGPIARHANIIKKGIVNLVIGVLISISMRIKMKSKPASKSIS